MSHKKVYSQGNIPFSWEDSPGVSKAIHQDFPIDLGLHALNLSSSLSPPCPSSFSGKSDSSSGPMVSAHQDIKIPLPPCQNLQPPRRSTSSAKGFGWWQEDPFLAAYKECTKNVRNGKLASENKKKVIAYKVNRRSMHVLSCKNSCEVKDDGLVRLSDLPPIPRGRVRGR